MQIELLAILSVIIIGFISLFILILKNKNNSSQDKALVEWLKAMQNSIDQTNKNLNESMRNSSTEMTKILQENSNQINNRLTRAAEVISDVNKEIGQMSEIGRSMKELQEFLKSPKLRGNIGEEVLKDLISQVFPKNSFNLQYQFKSGEKVDAAIKTDAGILPIDSKFPMENFQKMSKSESNVEKEIHKKEFLRDVRKHIDDISKKYILPSEGTMDFCLMYIPSETVYYEVADSPQILDYARKKRVYIVSPTTLYAHLQVILLSYEGKKIETKSKEIFATLRALKIDYQKVEQNLNLLGKHMNNATSQFTNVSTSFTQMGRKMDISDQLIDEVKNEDLLKDQ